VTAGPSPTGRRLWSPGLLLLSLVAAGCGTPDQPPPPPPASVGAEAPHSYVGMWVTADGHIRQELRPDGRYDEARGERRSAFTGDYQVHGDRIVYQDDLGFDADGRFDGDVLDHGGFVFYREGSPAHRAAGGPPPAR
jgi:hypothetical protein